MRVKGFIVIVGLLSDSHGHARRTRAALDVLRAAGAEAFIHCGDVGGLEVLEELAGLRVWVVCGNIDCPDRELEQRAAELGVQVTHEGPLRLRLAGRSLAAFHGHEAMCARVLERAARGLPAGAGLDGLDYVVHGHTHVARDMRVGPLRVVNPGALVRARVHTVATLDLAADEVVFWQVLDNVPPGAPPTPLAV